MKILFQKNDQGVSKIYHEVSLLMKFPETKPQVENLNIIYYHLYCTVVKNRNDNQIVKDEYQNYENDFISLNDNIIPIHYVGIKGREK